MSDLITHLGIVAFNHGVFSEQMDPERNNVREERVRAENALRTRFTALEAENARLEDVADSARGDNQINCTTLAEVADRLSKVTNERDELRAKVARLTEERDEAQANHAAAIILARGCVDYGGGYSGENLQAFHHGIATVVLVLEAALSNPEDRQVQAVRAVGTALANQPSPGGKRP